MSPIECAARALCEANDYDPDKDDEVGLGEPGDVNWNMFEAQARAVIAAIREPSEDVVQAGCRAWNDNMHCTLGQIAGAQWSAMIDALLAEGD